MLFRSKEARLRSRRRQQQRHCSTPRHPFHVCKPPGVDRGRRHVFQVEDMTKEHPIYEQDEATLKPWMDPHRLKKIQNMWYKDGRRVVTNNPEHRQSLIRSHHDPPVYRHPGINQTTCLLERYYWWPGLQNEVAEYVKGCAECQRHKVNNRPT